ncbi:organic cation transporter 1 [Caerostris extrusa]|uniref:Organic cation transporter 1 n=1 Tax=Caerostris extrusa TaxID=172846 RepID=A0AAV4QRJ6_CAEEX|nr:organic cation transporter 1 [Caerostris extrusa]
MVASKNELEFEDVLAEVGDYGSFQKRMLMFFLAPVATALPVLAMNILFLVHIPNHWCRIPEVAISNLTANAQQNLFGHDKSKCFIYDLNYTNWVESSHFRIPKDTPLIPCNNGWEYETTHFDETAASKWNLVCGDSHYSNLVLTLTNSGGAIGTFIYGTLGDKN